ncbi:hypothetical protein [Cellulomonas sp. PhB143]|uniref:hypothetical protein n=1 Tax=Cellulomonas sp. PhB143 TaxID=2485186 RepID=UPI000F96AC31|nr:hypothetical protein [Cellulomonas sp. PhB143]ROS76637.1 hypothetical protein EDF32_1458 [Cellulomonas sp. PhB143]
MDATPEPPTQPEPLPADGRGEDTARAPGAHGSPDASWQSLVRRFAAFSGLVGEVSDPLEWGMDLIEETLSDADGEDPSTERFTRGYVTFAGEPFGVETLRESAPADERDDVVRAALSSAIAAPLHTDIRPGVPTEHDGSDPVPTEDFADAYQDYRSAMRAVFDDVARATVETSPATSDSGVGPAARVTARGTTAQYVEVAGRALIVTGPTDLVERVQVAMRPIRNLLHDEDGPRF